MRNVICFILISAFCLFLPLEKTEAFVPRAPHLFYMVIQKIKQPAGLITLQTRKIIRAPQGSDPQMDEPEASVLPGSKIPGPGTPVPGSITLNEKLIYAPPDRLRVEVSSPDSIGFYVESDAGFIKVLNDKTIALEKSPLDFYTDVLLYRDYESLELKLAAEGIDTERVAFRRYGDRICYVVGRPLEKGKPFPGLWIEKESFFPVRYILIKKGWALEFRYENWQQVSRTWYPMETDIFMDGQKIAEIRVSHVELASGFSPDLFEVEGLKNTYPGADTRSPDKIRDLDRQLEEFKKLYE
ncbi:hypothetical protein [Desulfospira joergensenii]|uniref:hypothetical protein n=1 Tax=Desulfospira joergensenii TaxID=53329 RepID=UPI0003B3B3B3|nr:hypothetical protein [Desulfospira joergensenii]